LAVTLLAIGSLNDRAHAQGLAARYSVSMTGIPIGESTWTVDLGSDAYSISASGGAAGVMAILMNGTGTAEASGKIRDGRLLPASFTSKAVELGEHFELKMVMDRGTATAIEIEGPPPGPDRIPIKDGDREGIIDPLSALLLRNDAADGALAPETCNRTLPIFDGRRRYDLVLAYERVDQFTEVLEGAGLVCNIILRPISGHRADSAIMKYVAGRRDMAITFAPIPGTRFLAPFRLSVPTLLGTLAVKATQFASTRSR
jgi:hypothetical protein